MENLYLSDHDNGSAEKLLSDENSQDCKQTLKQNPGCERKSKSRRYLRTTRDIVTYALAFWGLFSIFTQVIQNLPNAIHHKHQHQHLHQELPDVESDYDFPETRRSCACGNSTAEAISLGCVYDSMSPAWMQPYCHDAELTTEFERLGDGPNGTWIYYADRNHTQELTMTEVMAMGDDPNARFHVTWKWHFVHCWMYWIKQFRSQTAGIVVEARYDTEAHIRHCAEVFQNPVFGTSSGVVLNADIDDP